MVHRIFVLQSRSPILVALSRLTSQKRTVRTLPQLRIVALPRQARDECLLPTLGGLPTYLAGSPAGHFAMPQAVIAKVL